MPRYLGPSVLAGVGHPLDLVIQRVNDIRSKMEIADCLCDYSRPAYMASMPVKHVLCLAVEGQKDMESDLNSITWQSK